MMPTYDSPQRPIGHIERRRLDHLYGHAVGRLVRVLGPGGYGKTSLVSRWVASDARLVAWVDVERAHNDPVVLLDVLREALADAVELPRASAVNVGVDDACIVAVRRGFTEVPPGRIAPFVLVLDDLHHLHSPVSSWMVETLARELPPSSTLVLVGRAHHDHGSMARLALAPGVVDVTVADLSFDESESHQVFESLGVPVVPSEIARLLALTDGWPAGVSLAAHAIGVGARPPDAADDVAIVDYLRSEWIGQLESHDHQFLREAACLRRFTSAICDEVLGRTGSAEVLRHLHRDQTVVFPLDRRDEWYRLHPLLARWLSADLRKDDVVRWVAIHRDASRYWESAGDIDRAVEHAQTAGDTQLEERLVVTHGSAYFPRGMGATVASWLEAFPRERVRASPGLSALSCLLAIHQGDGRSAAQWLRVHEGAGASAVDTVPASGTSWWANILHATLDERRASELIPLAEEACKHLNTGVWTSFGFYVLGGLHFLDGDVDRAQDALDAGMFEADLADTPLLRAHCLAMSSVIHDCVGDRTAAAAACHGAERLIAERHLFLVPPTACLIAMQALTRAREQRPDDARMLIEAARRALTGFSTVAPWFNVAARLALVRATLLLDDHLTSAALMRELEHHARFELVGPPDPGGGAVACLHELRRRVATMHRPATGASALTEAEIRVLHHLPSNLSLSDIAARLYLSRNTVKSHAASIYRKLGAQNRREAVERATDAGLLDGSRLSP